MPIVHDTWGNDVEVTRDYISYRNRLIDMASVKALQVKSKRLLINNYMQNSAFPTMCIFFKDKAEAENAFDVVKKMGSSIPDLAAEKYSELVLQKRETDQYAFIWIYWAVTLSILAFAMTFAGK